MPHNSSSLSDEDRQRLRDEAMHDVASAIHHMVRAGSTGVEGVAALNELETELFGADEAGDMWESAMRDMADTYNTLVKAEDQQGADRIKEVADEMFGENDFAQEVSAVQGEGETST